MTMWKLQSNKMNKSFVSIDPMKIDIGTKKSRMTNFMGKSFGWMLFWRNRPKKIITTMRNGRYSISPERTALMSFDELSTYNNDAPHCFMHPNSSSISESDDVRPNTLTSFGTEIFPSWHRYNGTNALPLDPKMKEATRKRRSLLYAFHNARIRSLSNVGKEEPQDKGDDESTNFSISTDIRYPPSIGESQEKEPQQQQHSQHRSDATSNNDTTVTTGTSVTAPPPPSLKFINPSAISDTASVRSSRSFQSIRSSRSSRSARSAKSMLGSIGNKSRISLDQFLEDRTQASSLITGPMMTTTNLGELPADFDAMSVGTSASLDVSFHGEYPQLVLTPSVDGTASRMTGSSIETNTGAASTAMRHCSSKGHNARVTVRTSDADIPVTPSSQQSVASFDTTKRNVTCTPQWLNENIDRVWKQFDQCKADPDGRYAPDDDPYDSNYDTNEEDDHLPYNKAEPEINEFRYQFKNGHISDLKRDGSGADDENIIQVISNDTFDFESTEEEENTDDDDVDAILDATTTDDDESGFDEEKKEENETSSMGIATGTSEKDDQFSFRSFSPFDDMGWSFSAGSAGGGRSISKMIETEVIYPILKPICELVEATEIPQSRTYHHHRHRHVSSSSNLMQSTSSSPPPPSSDRYSPHKNSSYRMSPRRYTSRNNLR